MATHLKNFVVEKEEIENVLDETDAILEKDINERRAQKKKIYRCSYMIAKS